VRDHSADRPVFKRISYFAGFFARVAGFLRLADGDAGCGFGGVFSITRRTSSGSGNRASGSGLRVVMVEF